VPSDHRLVLTAEAESHIAGIWQSVAETWGEGQAEDYTNMVLEKLLHLTHFPFLGRSRPDLSAELRSLVMGQHVAFYRVTLDAVIVRRVLHSRQDTGEAFTDG